MAGKSIKYLLALLLLVSAVKTFAQRDTSLTQEVEVVKSYTPSITDANKINEMPQIEESEQKKPTFNYSIFSQPIFNTFSVNTLKAATFADQPDENNGYGMIKAGLGNYYTPYGEIFFNSQNIRNTIFGLHGKHLSSHAKIKLDGGDRVKAPFSENETEMFIKHLFRKSILSVNLNFDHNGFRYYGYPVDSVPSVLKQENNVNYFGSKQAFTKGAFNINLVNANSGSRDATFDFNFLYHYFGTKTDQREHFGEFTANVKKPLEVGVGLLEAGATFVKASEIYNRSLNEIGNSQQIWLTAKPGYMLGGDVANIRVGINTWFVLDDDDNAKARITPNVRANFAPVKEIINIFAGVDGNYINNHYSKIAYENPFVDPMHDVTNTFEKLHFFGGFDGKFATKTNFKIAVDYSMIKDQPLYYLFQYIYPSSGSGINSPDPTITDNDFDILYDDLDLLKFNLEIFHSSSEKLDLLLSGNYYVYKLDTQEEAWNMPDWDANVSVGYKISDQLKVSTDLFLVGQRKALMVEYNGFDPRSNGHAEIDELPSTIMKSYNLNTIIDLNFNANYKITDNFSAFAQLHNFGFQSYQRWFGYPVQSFNFLGGISYSF